MEKSVFRKQFMKKSGRNRLVSQNGIRAKRESVTEAKEYQKGFGSLSEKQRFGSFLNLDEWDAVFRERKKRLKRPKIAENSLGKRKEAIAQAAGT